MSTLFAALLIIMFEGYSARVYTDPAGHGTIGYGHLVTNNIWYSFDKNGDHQLDRNEAMDLLIYDIERHNTWQKDLTVELTEGQFAAISSLAFNLGVNSTAVKRVIFHTNVRQYEEAAAVFGEYTKARINGKLVELAGLVKRREFERAMYLYGVTK